MKRIAAAALLSVTAFSASAFAQTAQPGDRAAPAVTTSKSSEKLALNGHWRASKLIGLSVYNDSNEKLGDINELILDKNGKVTAVVVGVGGFLGMGEHDIAVSMEKLKFKDDDVRGTATTATTKESTTGTATTTAPATTTNRTTTASVNDWTPDHAVMSASKDQLKALPQFKYSDYN